MAGGSPDAVKRYNIIKTGNTDIIYSNDVQTFGYSLVVNYFRKNQKMRHSDYMLRQFFLVGVLSYISKRHAKSVML